MLLRARILIPITAPPLEDGAVLVSGGRIAAIGTWADLKRNHAGPVCDLGEVVLTPGWINAHCHLDYTHLAAHLPPPRSFTSWIQGVLALKAGWSFSDYGASWLAGASQLLRSGCTTVVDFEAVPELLPDVWNSTPLRVVSALEMTGVRSPLPDAEVLASHLQVFDGLGHARSSPALAPHAPYSTRLELLRLCAEEARKRDCLLSVHVAESGEEFDMFRHARGPMHRWLATQRGGDDCGRISPVRHVLGAGIGGRSCLLVHVNYLDDGDAAAIADSEATVVHCPRSHDYFSHDPFPLRALQQAGVAVCIGTDSLLSVRKAGGDLPALDLRRELAAFAVLHPSWTGLKLLELVTTVPARALERQGRMGSLEVGSVADLVCFGVKSTPKHAAKAVVHDRSPVVASMIGGEWVITPGATQPSVGERKEPGPGREWSGSVMKAGAGGGRKS